MRQRRRNASGPLARRILAAAFVALAAFGGASAFAENLAFADGAAATATTRPAANDDPYPKAAAAYLVTVNGAVLWQRAPERPLPPASLTKIMTALVLLDDWQPGAVVRVSP